MGCGQTDQDHEERREKQELEAKNIIIEFISKYEHNIKLNEEDFHKKFISIMGYDVNLIGYNLYEEIFGIHQHL